MVFGVSLLNSLGSISGFISVIFVVRFFRIVVI